MDAADLQSFPQRLFIFSLSPTAPAALSSMVRKPWYDQEFQWAHSGNMRPGERFGDLYWLNYCVCCGLGCGSCEKPLCGHISFTACCKAVCCEQRLPLDPACYQVEQCCCLRGICYIPPKDMPCCIICGLKPFGGEIKMKDPPTESLTHTGGSMTLTWGRWLCWCCCARPRCEIKHLCCHHECFLRDHDESFFQCMAMNKCLCCWTHYHCPRPAGGPPCCICFNVPLPPSRAMVGTET